MKKAIVTVVGHDRTGIIARVSTMLAQHEVNILDISQTVMSDYFTMIMLTDVGQCSTDFADLKQHLSQLGKDMELSITIQHEDIFNAMHTVN